MTTWKSARVPRRDKCNAAAGFSSVEVHPIVNFSNVLRSAFTNKDPKSKKRQSSHQCHFALLGSASVKATGKTFVKLTPVVNVTLKVWKIVIFNGKYHIREARKGPEKCYDYLSGP